MRAWATCVLALACGAAAVRAAAAGPGGVIYTCRDDQGNPITRDRYIVECRHKEQRILNGDGSLRQVVPPTWTPEEQAQREAETRKKRESEQRSEERRVGKECRLLCRSRWSPYH